MATQTKENEAMVTKRKTNPNHKAEFVFGCHANCSCGWYGVDHYGKGAKKSAAGEWRSHMEKCETALDLDVRK
jgi:hypothetical protein